MKKVFAYYRVSTELQETGLESQELACQKYAEENNLFILDVFKEEESAFNQRPILESMLRRLGEVDGILVFDLDRLVRDPHEFAKILTLFFDLNKKIYQVSGQIDMGKDEDVLLARIKTDIADYESRKIRRRIKAGLERRKANGLPVGRPKKHISKTLFQKYLQNDKLIISKAALSRTFKVSRATLIRWMRVNGYEDLIAKQPKSFNKVNSNEEI